MTGNFASESRMGASTFAGILILPTKSQSAKAKMGRVMKLLKLAARA